MDKYKNYYQQGLNNEEVQQRINNGQQNNVGESITKTKSQIIKDNVLTLFNLLNLTIAIALALVNAWSNIIFILIILLNIIIGIVQELHAKKLVDDLSILTVPTVNVIRNGQLTNINVSNIVKDDVIVLESGHQVCNDSTVLFGHIESNESLLTGEADLIHKDMNDKLFSGSSVISGKCYAKVDHVGDDNYATSLVKEAQKLKKVNSELLGSMKKITKITSFLIVPLGIILFIEAFYIRESTLMSAVVTSSAGLLGMLPKGLVLLISISLAAGVARLAKAKVLVQDLFSLETLAHVDVLCLDKTGTITTGEMKVEKIIELSNLDKTYINNLIGSFLKNSDDNNATFIALKQFFGESDTYKCSSKISFSSLRKWSSMQFDQEGTLVVGATEKLLNGDLPKELSTHMQDGNRVIVIGLTKEEVKDNEELTNVTPLLAVILSDTIRNNTKETLDYFNSQGVIVKIISGDNVQTVSAVARSAGLKDYQSYIDMSQNTNPNFEELVDKYSIFGRVTPIHKKEIVQALQKNGHHVAMTGDGVNDLLALKEADCSIALADGSDASKQISQVVLLNSDFSSLKDVLLEGRKVVNNITRVAGVFFVKTIYSIVLSVICILANIPFPFIPVQITLIDAAIEAFPSFLTIFESDTRKVTGSFLPKVFAKAIPNSLAIVICIIASMIILPNFKLTSLQITTIMYLVVATITIFAVIRSCFPFTKLRIAVCTTMVCGFFGAILIGYPFLHIAKPTPTILLFTCGITLIGLLIERVCYHVVMKLKIFKAK